MPAAVCDYVGHHFESRHVERGEGSVVKGYVLHIKCDVMISSHQSCLADKIAYRKNLRSGFVRLPAKLPYKMYGFWLVLCLILLSKNICLAKFSALQLYEIGPWFYTIFVLLFALWCNTYKWISKHSKKCVQENCYDHAGKTCIACIARDFCVCVMTKIFW